MCVDLLLWSWKAARIFWGGERFGGRRAADCLFWRCSLIAACSLASVKPLTFWGHVTGWMELFLSSLACIFIIPPALPAPPSFVLICACFFPDGPLFFPLLHDGDYGLSHVLKIPSYADLPCSTADGHLWVFLEYSFPFGSSAPYALCCILH